METKDILGALLLITATMGGVIVTCFSRRARDAAFFFMVATVVIADRLDINFFGRYWYRGSTRGIEISFVDVIAVSVLVSSFLFPPRGCSRWRWPVGLGFMLLFFGYAFVCTVANEPRLFGMFELSKMVRGIIFFLAAMMFVQSERELGLLVVALCCAGCVEGLLALKHRLLDDMARSAGTLDHANSLSMYMCLTGPIFVAAINSTLPRFVRWFSAAALMLAGASIVLTFSRAGVPLFALVVLGATLWCMKWRFTVGKFVGVMVVLVGLTIIQVKFWDDLKQRYTESSLEEEYLNNKIIDSRGYYLRLTSVILEERFFGVGLNNWSYAVSKTYGERLGTPYANYDDIPADFNYDDDLKMNFAAPAHNLGALTLGELGVPGLGLFLLMWLRWFQMGASFLWRRKHTALHLLGVGVFFGMAGVFLQSLTEWVFRQTAIYLMFHVLIGVLASLYLIKRKARKAAAVREVELEVPEDQMAEVMVR